MDNKELQGNISLEWAVDGNTSSLKNHFAGVTDVNAASYNTIQLLRKTTDLYVVRDNKAAFDALKRFPGALLIGESTEPGLPFYSSNSATKIRKLNLESKTVIQKTNNGTAAVGEAFDRGAGVVFAFHWANLESVAKWLRDKAKDKQVTLIACGGREPVFRKVQGHLLEDWYCCQALQTILQGKTPDYEKYFSETRKSILVQYPPGDPSDENKDLTLQREKEFNGTIPVFSPVGEGVYKVASGLEFTDPESSSG